MRHHDELSKGAVFLETDKARQDCYNQAVAIRNLMEKIKKEVIPEKEKKKFEAFISDHTGAMSALLLWNRKVELEDDE